MYKVYWILYINYIGDGSRIFLRRTLRHKKKIKEPNLILSNLTETNIFSYGELSHGEVSYGEKSEHDWRLYIKYNGDHLSCY